MYFAKELPGYQTCQSCRKPLKPILVVFYSTITLLDPVVQKADNAIHWINIFPVENTIGFPNKGRSRCTYPLDTDLSSGWCYSTFWTTGAWCVPFPLFKECYSSFNDFLIFCDALISQFTRQTFHHCLIIPFLHFKNPKRRHKISKYVKAVICPSSKLDCTVLILYTDDGGFQALVLDAVLYDWCSYN